MENYYGLMEKACLLGAAKIIRSWIPKVVCYSLLSKYSKDLIKVNKMRYKPQITMIIIIIIIISIIVIISKTTMECYFLNRPFEEGK